jgi:uncharacterized protein (TIGR00255 family)
MIRSMTGFASLTHEDEHARVDVSVRAVNHRFLDLQVRGPSWMGDLETRARAILQRGLARGRVEVTLSVETRAATLPEVAVNADVIGALAAAFEGVRAQGLVTGGLTPGDLLRLPQAVSIRERSRGDDKACAEALAGSVERALERALEQLTAMRVREGAHLRADLDARLATLGGAIDRLAALADAGRASVEARLHERVTELSRTLPVDEALIAQEIVRTAARSDISEEVTRFRAHLAHWTALSDGPEPCGRKLDFLLQEMNREVNTIGSKADGPGVTEVVIAAKAELEKMREQVQNVE